MPELLKCPHCGKPMKWIMGNAIFSYWDCIPCNKSFEYDVWTEKFTDEVEMRSPVET